MNFVPKDGLAAVAENGLTSIVDARNYRKRLNQDAWKKANDEGKLTAKVAIQSLFPKMKSSAFLFR